MVPHSSFLMVPPREGRRAREGGRGGGGGGGKYQILALAKQVVGKQSRIGDFLAPSKHLHGKIPKQPHTHNPEQNLP